MAVRALVESFEALALESAGNGGALSLEQRLLYSIHQANRAVRDAAEANDHLHNMGTTLVCACLDGPRIVVGNVGDSRAYLIRGGVCTQITLDHSLLDEQVRQGLITPAEAAVSHLQSVITRAIGAADTVEPDLFAAELSLNDLFLLTSDGLTRYAKPEDIASAATSGADLSAICQTLIDHAKTRGGADNITCMMLRVVEKPQPELVPEPIAPGTDFAHEEAV